VRDTRPLDRPRLAWLAFLQWREIHPGRSKRSLPSTMKRKERSMRTALGSLILVAVCALVVSAGTAEGHGHHHKRHHHCSAPRDYDPGTIGTHHCTVESVEEGSMDHCRECRQCVHLAARCEGKLCRIHLGPAGFLRDQGWTFEQGQTIEVTGSLLVLDGTRSLVASGLKRDDSTLQLRDDLGRPLWSDRR